MDDPELSFSLEVDISYPLPVNGLSRASWPHEIVTLEVREQDGRTTFAGTSFGQSIPTEPMGSEPFEAGLYYRYTGSIDELTGYTETFRDLTDTQILVSYRLGDDCETEVLEPPKNDPWTLSDSEGVILEKYLKAESLPRVWADDLTWELDDLGELEAEFELDPARGSEARVWYEGTLPEHNSDLDRDFIPDDREAELGFDPNSRDTYGMGRRDGDCDCDYWDDSEITAYQAQESWPVGSADKEDWADPGKQSGG